MRNKHAILSAKGLHKQYGKRMVVKDVDVSLERGEIVGLLGPNGAGKTTSFYMITGMIKPTKGNIFLDDYEITNDAMYKRARKGIGYLAQEPSIFGKLTVEDNLKLVLELRKDLTEKDQREKMELLLQDLSVSHLAQSKGNTLSGGGRGGELRLLGAYVWIQTSFFLMNRLLELTQLQLRRYRGLYIL